MTQPFEVYAIRYARLRKTGREMFLFCPEPLASETFDMDYSLWAVKGPAGTFVIDTGYSPATARKLGRELLCDPVDALRDIGIEPETAQTVILTHLHYDHAGNLDRFPNAEFIVHEAEMAYVTSRHVQEPPVAFAYHVDHVVEIVRAHYASRTRLLSGDTILAPGLELYHVPGHSPGHMCLRIWTRRGWLLLAIDAAHFLRNVTLRRPFPLYLDIDQVFRGFDRIAELQPDPELVICGHDADVIERYPSASPQTQGRISRLDADPIAPLGYGPERLG